MQAGIRVKIKAAKLLIRLLLLYGDPDGAQIILLSLGYPYCIPDGIFAEYVLMGYRYYTNRFSFINIICHC
jgi:hypothetical protein